VSRQLKRIAFPILRPKNLDTRIGGIADLLKGRNDFRQRQNAESRQQSLRIGKLLAWQLFRVIDMKDEQTFGVEGADHLDGRSAGIKVKAIDYQAYVPAVDLNHDFV